MLGAPTLGVLVALVFVLAAESVARVTRKIRGLEGELSHARTESRFRALVQHSSDMIAIVERDGTLRYASPAVTQILRRDALGLVGTSLLDLLAPNEVTRARAFLDGLVAGGSNGPVEWCFQLPNGIGRNLETIATNLLEDPDVHGIVLNCRDVTERKALEDQLVHRAFHDGLTGLANRALFYDRIVHAQTAPNAMVASWPCFSWTWTTSKRSTTASASSPTSCCARPTWRCTPPKPTAKVASKSLTMQWTPARASGCRPRSSCAEL